MNQILLFGDKKTLLQSIHCCGWFSISLFAGMLSFVPVSSARADAYAWEFRPGPNVPSGFKPSPHVDASGMDLRGSSFIGMNLRYATFDNCDLRNARFLQVDFTDNLRGQGASFQGADLRSAFFEEPDIHELCDFTGALINGIVFAGGHKHFMSVEQIRSTKSYKIKDLSRCYLMGEVVSGISTESFDDAALVSIRMDFSGLNLEGATLAFADFTKCDFTGADMSRVHLKAVRLNQSQIKSSRSFGSYMPKRDNPYYHHLLSRHEFNAVDFVTEQYSGMMFGLVDLSNWNLRDCNVQKTAFRSVRLDQADFSGADIRGAYFHWSINRRQLCSTRSYREGNMSRVTFREFDFTDFDFLHQNLSGAVFEGCNLTDADFTSAVITNAAFPYCRGLTVRQVKSTWNYKNNRMAGIDLPEELAASLEAENGTKENQD